MQSASKAIELKKISVTRGRSSSRMSSKTQTLTEISAYAFQGELVALLGESGIGKTSVLRLIAGLERLDRGELSLRGITLQTPVQTLDPEGRQLAYVSQTSLLFPHLNVLDNVRFSLMNIAPKAQRRVAEEALSLVELGSSADCLPHQLSGGQSRRVELARALARVFSREADLLLIDEAFSSLEPALRTRILTRISKQCSESQLTVIWSTHLIDVALTHAQRLWVLERQDRLYNASPFELYTRPPTRFTASLLGELSWASLESLILGGEGWERFSDSTEKSSHELVVGLRPTPWTLSTDDHAEHGSRAGKDRNEDRYLLRGRITDIKPTIEWILVDLRIGKETEDLPNSTLIRMKLSQSIRLQINQEVTLQYLGEPLVFRGDEVSS